MKIEFTGRYTVNTETFGINFIVMVEKETIVCEISQEALQDINPKNRLDDIKNQFLSNQSRFQEIAKEKILNRESKILF